ncbi:MAG: hypothetical protein RRC34_05660 [Lentisphaeria bacterium]|nr:hypothetical protein [Lentisphaeria bacterium]
MIFFSTDDPSFNTVPPDGYYAGSGWQWQGRYGYGTGTVVSPDQVLTAKHFAETDQFVIHGKAYAVLKTEDDPHSDLRLLTLDVSAPGPFSSWAPLYTGSSEKGKEVVVHGRGRGRGEEVIVDDRLRGWLYADTVSGLLQWGTNEVVEYAPYGNVENALLRAEFDLALAPTECHLADWDSGGGVFLKVDGEWKLAGVNYAVDSRFATVTGNSATFQAALFDIRGMSKNGRVMPSAPGQIASSFYATRVSRRLEWLSPRLRLEQKKSPPLLDPAAAAALVVFALAGGGVVVGARFARPREKTGVGNRRE